jgi:7-cyano-7-deazaguanine synthase
LQKKASSLIISKGAFKMEKSIVLFSGGIDSTTALYWALQQRKKTSALTFDYGQRHLVEIELAQRLTAGLNIPHKILRIDFSQIGGSSLTDSSLPLPEYERAAQIEKGLPTTYVPFRNGIFLALAAAWAEANGSHEIVCGFHVLDSPHYPDTREAFVKAMEKAINSGTGAVFGRRKIRILAPFLKLSKSEIIRRGLSLGADYSYSISCYSGSEVPCMKCSSCLLRRQAWEEIETKDPLLSRLAKEGKL